MAEQTWICRLGIQSLTQDRDRLLGAACGKTDVRQGLQRSGVTGIQFHSAAQILLGFPGAAQTAGDMTQVAVSVGIAGFEGDQLFEDLVRQLELAQIVAGPALEHQTAGYTRFRAGQPLECL